MKRFISLMLVFAMTFGILPLNEMIAFADTTSKIYIDPNRGPASKEVTIIDEGNNIKNDVGVEVGEEISVFFLEKPGEFLKKENLAESLGRLYKEEDDDGNTKIKIDVRVPNRPINEYTILLTKKIDIKSNVPIEDQLTAIEGAGGKKRVELKGKFKISRATQSPLVTSIYNSDSGETNTGIPGQRARLTGRNILIPSDDLYDPPSEGGKIKYESAINLDDSTMKIEYRGGSYDFSSSSNGTKEDIYSLTRIIKAEIGGNVKFGKKGEEPVFDIGDNISINLPNIPVRDDEQRENVKVTVETIIMKTENDDPIKYIEESNKDIEFIYKPSEYATKNLKVYPAIIPVEKRGSNFETSEDIQLGIYADNISIYSTVKNGVPVTKYPIVTIARKDITKTSDIDMKILKEEPKGSDKWVEIDGNPGKQLGEKILLTIPKGTKFDSEEVETINGSFKTTSIQIKNPTKDMNSDVIIGGQISYEITLKEVNEKDIPKIKEVYRGNKPTTGTPVTLVIPVEGTKGGEVKITGPEFSDGTEVYFEGKPLGAKLTDNRTLLTFDMPPRKKGAGILVIQNKDSGGTIIFKDVIYVETKDQPKIIEYGPKKLEKDTWVTVRGDNFFSSDVSVTSDEGQDIYSLIGSRVKIDGKDINEENYNKDNGKIKLRDLRIDLDKDLFISSLINKEDGGIKVNDAYNSIVLENTAVDEDEEKYYKIVYDINDMKYKLTDGKSYSKEIQSDTEYKYSNGILEIDGKKLKGRTMYKEPLNNKVEVITNNKLRDGSSKEIRFKMPKLKDVTGQKNIELSIQNSDFKESVEKANIDYRVPNANIDRPKVDKIYLNENDKNSSNKGSYQGNYYITIKGENFGAIDDKTEVYIGANKIKSEDVLVIDNETLKVNINTYPWNLPLEVEKNIKQENVVLVNTDGTTNSNKNGFIYVTPNNTPTIKLTGESSKGSTLGGQIIRITGSQILLTNDDYSIKPGDNIKELSEEKKKVLPSVFFGSTQVEVVEVGSNYLDVKTPSIDEVVPMNGNKANVYIVNNDYGVSNKVVFEYIKQDITITGVTPAKGNTKGYKITGEKVDVLGSGFKKSNIRIDGKPEEMKQLVQFGNLDEIYTSNRNSNPTEEKRYGIIGSTGSVELENMKIEYKKEENKTKLSFEFTENDKKYSLKNVEFDDKEEFYSIDRFTDSIGNKYEGYELIRVRVEQSNDNKRLIVDRGFSPQVSNISDKHLEVNVPSYHFPKGVKLTVINPDKGSANIGFEYISPQSSPKITNILKDGNKQPKEYDSKKSVNINYKGENKITIRGKGFTNPAKIEIVQKSNPLNKKVIPVDDITYEDEEKDLYGSLSFNMPIIEEESIGDYYVIVTNNDGAYGRSDGNHLEKPIYIEVTTGRSNPVIESVTPNEGPSTGGTTVTIRGDDFREYMKEYDYEGRLMVKIVQGNNEKIIYDAKVNSHKEIVFVTPPHKPGVVTIKVENPDGETSTFVDSFTYISNPKITNILNPETNTLMDTISIDGNQKIKVVGNDFMEGARVIFNPKLKRLQKNEEAKGDVVNINGTLYLLESGEVGTNVDVLSGDQLTVITPKGSIGTGGIIVINTDKGTTPIYNIKYGIPEIGHPQEVRATLIKDEYIRINWNEVVDKSTEDDGKEVQYEVYMIEGGTREFIGSTGTTGFVFKDIKPNTTYEFLVRAVGKYGSSKPLDESISNKVKTGSKVESSDKDGELGEKTKTEKSGDTANIIIGKDAFNQGAEYVIDLTRGTLSGSNKVVVSMSAKIVVEERINKIKIIGKDYGLSFSPSVFENDTVISNKGNLNAGVKFEVSPVNINFDLAENKGDTVLASKYHLRGRTYVASSGNEIENLNGKMNFILDYDSNMVTTRRLKSINLVKYDAYDRRFKNIVGNSGYGTSAGDINELGTYTIIGSRR